MWSLNDASFDYNLQSKYVARAIFENENANEQKKNKKLSKVNTKTKFLKNVLIKTKK